MNPPPRTRDWPSGRIVEDAGLPGRNPVLAAGQFDLDLGACGGTAQPGRLRRPGRADLDENLAAIVGQRLLDRPVADPVDLAQLHAAPAQRLARPDDHAPGRRIEPDHIERMPGGDAETAPLPDREMDDAVVAADHAAVEIDDVAGLGGARPQPLDMSV